MSFKSILLSAAAAGLILAPAAFAQTTSPTPSTPDSSDMTAPQNNTGVTTVNSNPHGRSTDVSKSGFNKTGKAESGAPSASASGADTSETTVAPNGATSATGANGTMSAPDASASGATSSTTTAGSPH